MPQPSPRLGHYSEGPLRTTPQEGHRSFVFVRREEAGPLLRRPASLVARAPMAGAVRLSTGWQLRHEGVSVAVEGSIKGAAGSGVVEGGGAPRHVGPATFVHRYAVTRIGIRSPKEGGVGQRRARRVELRHEGVKVAV